MMEKLLTLIGIKRKREDPEPLNSNTAKKCKCPICTEFIVNCTVTMCGHSFCEYCLNQSMIYSSLCPLCRKRISITSCCPCKPIDSLIVSQLNESQLSHYKSRKQLIEN